ncbi:hypothetical protein Vretimale_19291, partial [Volvox reticuliferus]
ECPVIPGYIANTDVTHTGDFMGDAWTTSAAATSCSSDTQCRAFDDNGGMVIAYLPLATSEGRCLYVKIRPANPPPPPRPPPRSPSPPPPVPPSPILYPSPPSPRPPSSTVCPAVPDYIAIPDSDHIGDDVPNSNPSELPSKTCTNRYDCLGFTSDGVLKAKPYPVVEAQGKCLYVKNASLIHSGVCGALYEAYGMTYKQDWGLASSYTEVQTMYTSADCDTKLCTYFRHKYNATGPGKWGTLPTAVQPGWTAANCTSINSVCEMLMSEHFMVTPYVAYYGGSIATFSPNIYALDKCIKSTDCMAVDQGGTLRSNVFSAHAVSKDVNHLYVHPKHRRVSFRDKLPAHCGL